VLPAIKNPINLMIEDRSAFTERERERKNQKIKPDFALAMPGF
jgi:hypothetical protein